MIAPLHTVYAPRCYQLCRDKNYCYTYFVRLTDRTEPEFLLFPEEDFFFLGFFSGFFSDFLLRELRLFFGSATTA